MTTISFVPLKLNVRRGDGLEQALIEASPIPPTYDPKEVVDTIVGLGLSRHHLLHDSREELARRGRRRC